ncbi:MAG: tetratricopeptide repeat protein [Saprospiraceae bacterium]|nr:tetratricopeptide repeat protein [Saprospiraceae bacterium]
MNQTVGKFALSLGYFFDALKIFEELGNQQGIANQNLSIGSVYMEQLDFEKALHYDSLAMQAFQSIGDLDGVGLVLGNLANIYSDQNKKEAALEAYQKAIEIYETLGNGTSVARNLSNMSTIYMERGNYQEALQLLERALQLSEADQNYEWICSTKGNIGSSYFMSYLKYHSQDSNLRLIPGKRNELYNKAVSYMNSAAEMALKVNDWKRIYFFAQELSKIYAAENNYENAYKNQILFMQAKDSMNSLDVKRELERLTTEREVLLKDKQIELDRLAVEKKRNERLYFGIGIALLLISTLFIYRNYTNQKNQISNLPPSINRSQIAIISWRPKMISCHKHCWI